MTTPFVGEVRMGGWNFAPVGWASCNGQVLPIAQYNSLFLLIGVTYGGDGVNNFALPDLQSRSVYGRGTSASGTYSIGQTLGVETVQLGTKELPAHTHVAAAVAGPAVPNAGTVPENKLPNGQGNPADPPYGAAPGDLTMSPAAIANTGGNQAHLNIQPVLAINFVIALDGVLPQRN